jgi:hypothetical protein
LTQVFHRDFQPFMEAHEIPVGISLA